MSDNDEVRKSIAYHGSVPGQYIMLEKDGEDLVPEYDDNGMFVIDPKDGEKTYIVWS
jgi:hypothetical protein